LDASDAGSKQESAASGTSGAAGDDIESWVALHWDSVYRLVHRLCGNRHEAEDLAQETFLKAIERRASYQPGTNLLAWLLRIATNGFLDRHRRKKSLRIGPLPEEIRQESPPGQGVEGRELYNSLLAAINTLPDMQRVIFLLRGEEGLSFREIAQIVDMTEETARWHMMQARKQLLVKLHGKL
jgi:RNA polymerase sigma-70 factor, ECF subfamily